MTHGWPAAMHAPQQSPTGGLPSEVGTSCGPVPSSYWCSTCLLNGEVASGEGGARGGKTVKWAPCHLGIQLAYPW